MNPWLEDAVSSFRRKFPECQNGDLIHDRCWPYSAEFIRHVEIVSPLDVDNEVVSGVHFDEDNRIILAGHAAARIGDTVFDWTLRQFYPDADVPTITPLAQWREDWKPLKEASA